MIKKIFTFVLFMCLCFNFVSCSSDDDNTEVNDISTVIGNEKKWCIYKVKYKYSNGEEITIDVDKYENYTTLYREFTFREDNTCTIAGWEEETNKITKWSYTEAVYTVKDDVITICYDKETVECYAYDKRTKNLIATVSFKTTTSPILTGTATIYIKRNN